jgi:protein-disulfide isomerase
VKRFSRRDALVLGGLAATTAGVALLARRSAPVGPDIGSTPVVRAAHDDRDAPTGGNPAGDVALLLYTDYNCSACRRAHPAIEDAVGEDGNTRLVFKDWPIFGANSQSVARAAIAAAPQGLYEPLHARLMRTSGPVTLLSVEAAVRALGGSWATVKRTLDRDGARIDAMLTRHAFEAFALGLGGTPGQLVGTILVRGARSARDYARAIAVARASGIGRLKGET